MASACADAAVSSAFEAADGVAASVCELMGLETTSGGEAPSPSTSTSTTDGDDGPSTLAASLLLSTAALGAEVGSDTA